MLVLSSPYWLSMEEKKAFSDFLLDIEKTLNLFPEQKLPVNLPQLPATGSP